MKIKRKGNVKPWGREIVNSKDMSITKLKAIKHVFQDQEVIQEDLCFFYAVKSDYSPSPILNKYRAIL